MSRFPFWRSFFHPHTYTHTYIHTFILFSGGGADEEDVAIEAVKSSEISVIDGRRAQNCTIVLMNLKMTNRQIHHAILSLDEEQTMPNDIIEQMIKYVPTVEEVAMLKDLENQVDLFAAADRFMYEMHRIPRYEPRLKAIFFKRKFVERLAYVVCANMNFVLRDYKSISEHNVPNAYKCVYVCGCGCGCRNPVLRKSVNVYKFVYMCICVYVFVGAPCKECPRCVWAVGKEQIVSQFLGTRPGIGQLYESVQQVKQATTLKSFQKLLYLSDWKMKMTMRTISSLTMDTLS